MKPRPPWSVKHVSRNPLDLALFTRHPSPSHENTPGTAYAIVCWNQEPRMASRPHFGQASNLGRRPKAKVFETKPKPCLSEPRALRINNCARENRDRYPSLQRFEYPLAGSVAKFEISLRLGMLQGMTQIAKQQSWISKAVSSSGKLSFGVCVGRLRIPSATGN